MSRLLSLLSLLSLAAVVYSKHVNDPLICNLTWSTQDHTTCAYVYVKLILNSSNDSYNIGHDKDGKCEFNITSDTCIDVIKKDTMNVTDFSFDFNWTDSHNKMFKGSSSINFTSYLVGKSKKVWNVSDWTVDIELNSSYSVNCSIGNSLFHYSLDQNRSYSCNHTKSYSSCSASNWFVVISDLQLQAFLFTTTNYAKFDTAYRCDADIKGSKYIPIIVGGVLAGLVAIVFVAYIVGRLRNHRQALYEKIDS